MAVSISEEARQQLALLLDRLGREPGLTVRWVRPELAHLTLAFLGEVSPEFIETAKVELSRVARQHRAFTMRLKALGAFPSRSRARVVWVGTDKGRSEVCALQKDVVAALSSIGYLPERRPFSPHLTVGRLRVPGDVSRAAAIEFESAPFVVDRVALYRSVLGPGGPTYHELSQSALQAH